MAEVDAVEGANRDDRVLPFRNERPEPEMNLHQVRVYRRRRARAEIAKTAI